MYQLAARVGLSVPFRGVAQAVGNRLVFNALVKLACLQLVEETGNAPSLVGEVVDGKAFLLKRAEERLGNVQHAILGLAADVAQRLGVLVEEIFLLQLLAQLLADVLVVVAKDGLTELLNLADDVPRLVVADVLHDVLHNPLQHDVGSVQVFYQLVDGQFLNLRVIQPDVQVGRQVQLAGQVAQHALEERVDGHDTEVVVVVQQQRQGYACPLADKLGRGVEGAAYLLHIAVRLRQLLPDAVELTQYARFHFLSSLVGEGDGQNVTVRLRVAYNKFDVLHSQGKGLAAAGTGFINGEWFYHRLNSSKVNLLPKL